MDADHGDRGGRVPLPDIGDYRPSRTGRGSPGQHRASAPRIELDGGRAHRQHRGAAALAPRSPGLPGCSSGPRDSGFRDSGTWRAGRFRRAGAVGPTVTHSVATTTASGVTTTTATRTVNGKTVVTQVRNAPRPR